MIAESAVFELSVLVGRWVHEWYAVEELRPVCCFLQSTTVCAMAEVESISRKIFALVDRPGLVWTVFVRCDLSRSFNHRQYEPFNAFLMGMNKRRIPFCVQVDVLSRRAY